MSHNVHPIFRPILDVIKHPSERQQAEREHMSRVLSDVRRGRRAAITPYAHSIAREHAQDMATIERQAFNAFARNASRPLSNPPAKAVFGKKG